MLNSGYPYYLPVRANSGVNSTSNYQNDKELAPKPDNYFLPSSVEVNGSEYSRLLNDGGGVDSGNEMELPDHGLYNNSLLNFCIVLGRFFYIKQCLI